MNFFSKARAGFILLSGLAVCLTAGYGRNAPASAEDIAPAPGIEAPPPSPPQTDSQPDWRSVLSGKQPISVGLMVGAVEITAACRGPFQIQSEGGGSREGQPGETLTFSDNIKYPVNLIAGDGGVWQIAINGKPLAGDYPATLKIFPSGKAAKSGLTLVNILPLDDYVAGVTAKEMPASFSLEALRAQAIAVRSYSLYYLGLKHIAEGFDLCSGSDCQMYSGLPDPLSRAAYAAASTKGQVLLYHDQPIRAQYFSTCGGETAMASFLKADANGSPPYLAGASDCDPSHPLLADEKQARDFLGPNSEGYCVISPHYRWTQTFRADEVNAFAVQNLARLTHIPDLKPGKVKSLQVIRRLGGRAQALQVDTESGSYTLAGDDIRWFFGKQGLKSTFFVLDIKKDSRDRPKQYIFTGAGWGHGVGMCQYGADGRARAGQSAAEILEAYYPGAQLWISDTTSESEK
jgi:SpoIID/LytB domain protein